MNHSSQGNQQYFYFRGLFKLSYEMMDIKMFSKTKCYRVLRYFYSLLVSFFYKIVDATYSKLHVFSRPGREHLAKCSFYSQLPYFIYCFSLFLYNVYLMVAKLVFLPKTENLIIHLPLIFAHTIYVSCVFPLYILLPK